MNEYRVRAHLRRDNLTTRRLSYITLVTYPVCTCLKSAIVAAYATIEEQIEMDLDRNIVTDLVSLTATTA